MTNKTKFQKKCEIIEISFFSVDVYSGSPGDVIRNY